MTRGNNVVVRESNDNINHRNMVIMLISFPDEVKDFSQKHA